MSNASIIEGRCMICDRAIDGDKSSAFQLETVGQDSQKMQERLAMVESDGKLCVAPGSLACLGRAVDWRSRYKSSVNQMMELANDTLVSVAKMVREHHAALDHARAEGSKIAEPIIAELTQRVDYLERLSHAAKQWMATCPDVEPGTPGYSEYATLQAYFSETGKHIVMSEKARTWHNGVQDAIDTTINRRDMLVQQASIMVTPSPAAIQMADLIVRDLRAMLARGKRDQE